MTFDKNRQLIPKLLPKTNISQSDNGVTNISLTLDKRDLGQKDTIIKKMLKRNGIDVSKVTIQEQMQEYSERPCVKATMQIDIQDFKIGLLKIAYEFTVDTINSYFNDPIAISISKILYEADMSKMEQEIIFLGDGLNKEILKPFAHLIEFENNNHYLILTQLETLGLVCFVNIFNCFTIGIKMSDLYYSELEDNIIIGINDMINKRFNKIPLSELVNKTYSPMEYRFQYWFPSDIDTNNFLVLQKDSNFGFYTENNNVPFFDKNGVILYADINDKINQQHLKQIHKGDEYNELITEIILDDEELYIKIIPSMNLVRVVSVQLEQYRVSKM